MSEGHTPVVPLDAVVHKTIVLGYRAAIEMMGLDPDNVDTEDVLADFNAWLASKIADSPEGQFVEKFGAEWDLIESTDGYNDFADDVGCALDEIRSKK